MVIHCTDRFKDNDENNYKYLEYFRLFPYPLSDFQKWSIFAIVNGHHSLITAHTGSGKCFEIDTPIMMYDGSIKFVQDIKVGNKLMGDDSTPRNVLGLARGIESMYKITLSDGDSFGCNESHILCLKYNIKPFITNKKNGNILQVNWFDSNEIKMRSKSFNYKNNDKEICIREANLLLNEKILNQMSDFNISVKDYLKLPKFLQRNSLSYKVGVEFPEKNIPIDPYIIGLWLGDGDSNSSAITNQDSVILKYLTSKLGEYDCYLQYRSNYTYGFTTLKKYTNRGRDNYIKTILRKYNLLNNKHIPDDYKINSRENRLKLLAGLIDSDGYYHYKGYEITQKNTLLANDIVYLVKSLGFACKIKKVKKNCYYKGEKREGEYNRISIFGDNLKEIPILCKRKKYEEERFINKPALEYQFKIEPEGIGNYYGFELDGNHKFLLANFIVTHNTLPAEFAIQFFKEQNKKVIYTAPIKALCNQKYYDFKLKFPHISIGILTGDVKDNPEADVLIMTTEILRNTLFTKKINQNNSNNSKQTDTTNISSINLHFEMDIDTQLGAVVFDEVHYIGDKDRGSVWEQSILLLPPQVQLIMLSATIEKPEIFATWIETEKNKHLSNTDLKRDLYMTTTYERVVPLTHYGWVTAHQSVIKDTKNTPYQEKIKEIVNKPIELASSNGNFNEINYYKIHNILNYFQKNKIYIKRQFVLNELVKYLYRKNMLPAICFVFSRKNVEVCAKEITLNLFDKDDKTPSIIEHECEKILISKLKNYKEYTNLEEYKTMISLLQKGIAIHHAGIMPILREMVELLFEKKYIKLLFATETFAVGINMPTKTVIFTGLSKFSGNDMRYLLSHEYTQMAGRAGRRGIDTIGHVIHCNNLFNISSSCNDYRNMLTGSPKMLTSQFKISFNLILNIISTSNANLLHTIDHKLITFMEKSFIQNDITKEITNYSRIQEELNQKISDIENDFDDSLVCKTSKIVLEEYFNIQTKIKMASNKQKKKFYREITNLENLHKYLKNDIKKYENLEELKVEREKNCGFKLNAVNYIQTNIDSIVQILKHENFIDFTMCLSEKAIVAMQLQEVHSLALADLYEETNGFNNVSAIQLVCIFSCFTNISIPNDMKLQFPECKDSSVKNMSESLTKYINKYYDLELDYQLDTGTDYKLHYELLDTMNSWCNAEDEISCKLLINKLKNEKEIFLGEFVKAILKINNVAAEFEKICESLQNISLLQKVKEIPQLTLKYIATNQSLYI